MASGVIHQHTGNRGASLFQTQKWWYAGSGVPQHCQLVSADLGEPRTMLTVYAIKGRPHARGHFGSALSRHIANSGDAAWVATTMAHANQ